MTRGGGNMSVKEDHSMCCMCFLYQRKDEGEKKQLNDAANSKPKVWQKGLLPFYLHNVGRWASDRYSDCGVASPRFGETDMHLRQFHDPNKEQFHPFLDLPNCRCICVHLMAITF